MKLRKIATVARREYVETVKTKAFVIGLLLTPLLVVGIIFLSTRLTVQAAREGKPFALAVVDRTGQLGDELADLVRKHNDRGSATTVELRVESPADAAAGVLEPLKRQVREGTLFAALDLPADLLDANASCVMYVRGRAFDERGRALRRLLNETVSRVRYAREGLDANRMMKLARSVRIEQRDVSGKQERSVNEVASMMTPFAFLFLLFMGIFGVSQGLLTSVIEEKSSRVVEVLLSALSPLELMAGKIAGIAGVGFTLVLMWATAAYGAAVWKGVQDIVQITHVGAFLLYFVLGFLLIASMLAALGSACNTLKEAQGLMAPLTVVLIIPMVLWFNIVQHPETVLSTMLSFVPPMTPMVMILRLTSTAATGVPIWQQIVAPIWLAAWVAVAIWAAARVFRVGILMYGKPPGLLELAKWVRYR